MPEILRVIILNLLFVTILFLFMFISFCICYPKNGSKKVKIDKKTGKLIGYKYLVRIENEFYSPIFVVHWYNNSLQVSCDEYKKRIYTNLLKRSEEYLERINEIMSSPQYIYLKNEGFKNADFYNIQVEMCKQDIERYRKLKDSKLGELEGIYCKKGSRSIDLLWYLDRIDKGELYSTLKSKFLDFDDFSNKVPKTNVLVKLLLSGEIIEQEYGYRAEKAEIIAYKQGIFWRKIK